MATNKSPSSKDLLLAQASRDALILKRFDEAERRDALHGKKLDEMTASFAKALGVPHPTGDAPVIAK